MVLNKLLLLSDIIKFSSVCTNWRSVAKGKFNQLKLRPYMYFNRDLPMLLIPSLAENNEFIRSLYSINQGEIYDLHLQAPYKKRCCGSSHGWLITLDGVAFEVNLINPFYFGSSKGIIHLPQFSPAIDMYKEIGEGFSFEYVICKAILSSDPISSPNEFVVMVIYGEMRMLAFWKPGAEIWTYITWSLPQFFDVIYVKDHFLAVNTLGQIYSCEINDDANPTYNLRSICDSLMGLLGNCCRRYIVELPDKTIMQVIRILKACMCTMNGPILTIGFFIYKMVVDDNGRNDWLSIETLEDGALFLGDNYSLYVSASQFPGCRSNSIYFTDDYHDSDAMLLNPYQLAGPFDIGVFLLDEKRIDRYYIPMAEEYHFPPPIWILPTL